MTFLVKMRFGWKRTFVLKNGREGEKQNILLTNTVSENPKRK